MTTVTAATLVNGVDVREFENALAEMANEPGLAAFQFRSSTRWKSGAIVASTFAGYKRDGLYVSRTNPHELQADEPPVLLGTGTAVGPTGHLIHALSHSLAVTMVYLGTIRGVTIDTLRVDAEGVLDLQGLLGLDERVKPGFKQIHLHVQVTSASAPDSIRRLLADAQARSPIWQTLAQPTRVDWTFDIDAADATPDTGDVRHGVDMRALTATVAAIQETRDLAKCRFFTSSEWLGGARVASTNPGFDQAEGELLTRHRDVEPKGYTGDQLRELAGTDTGVAPEEALLQAMGSCLSVTTSYHAAARGIRLEALEIEFEGDVDLRGFADLDDRVRAGYEAIRGRVYVKAGASEQTVREFLDFTTAHSPMCNSVAKPVSLTTRLTCNGTPA